MIIKLHSNLINKIAAGEVVERPASVLKELVENSIDAGSNKITINIKNAGIDLIEVIDNGRGMSKDDASIACDSHSTSKITSLKDLENINSMGFRGEALASISSVAELELQTKNKKENTGTLVKIDNSKKIKIEETSTNKGTRISIRNLFAKVPARKKFLKSQSTEYKHILATFYNYALAFPNIHFIFTHNGKEIHNLPISSKDSFNKELKIRINDLFGNKISSKLVELKYNSPYIQILGFTGHPSLARSRRSYQLIFLNKRPINNNLISKAVYDSYRGLIPKGRYPIFFLFIKMNPIEVDVNVHPRKSEVKFENPQKIFSAVKQSAKHTLLQFVKNDAKKALDKYSYLNTNPKISKPAEKNILKPQSYKGTYKPLDSKPNKKTISQSMQFSEELLKPSYTSPSKPSYIPYKACQVFNEFIIIEKDNYLQIIDQHAAAERVTYEHLHNQLDKKNIDTQKLLIPDTIELNKIEFEVVNENKKMLNELGIRISLFGDKSFKIEEVPALISKADISKLIEDLISDLNSDKIGKEADSFKDLKDHIIATMACHSSIRAGMKLNQQEMEDLVKKLLNCDNPYSCPHGRPIIWKISKQELEKKFKRT